MSAPFVSRRRFLGNALALGAATAAVPSLLAACSGDDGSAPPSTGGSTGSTGSTAESATPTTSVGRGVELVRLGIVGSPAPTLDPRRGTPGADRIPLLHVYDSLVLLKGGDYELQLAESVEPNADGTEWTIRVRDGIAFSDGRPLGAADVIHSMRTMGDPATSPSLASFYADVDLANLTAADARTLVVPLRRGRGDFLESMLAPFSIVFPDGTTTFDTLIGSGPYSLADYQPGRSARLEANPDYWGATPTAQAIEVVVIADPAARMRALQDGQIDYAADITATAVQSAGRDVAIRRGGAATSNALMFAMNTTMAPFDQPAVRKAVRQAVDRQALVDTILLGQGTVGEDVVGKGLPGYADLPPRQPDADAARSALAGVGDLSLLAADYVPGIADAARLFAQQLGDAGVHVDIDQRTRDAVFSDPRVLATMPFQAFYFINRPAAVHLGINTAPGALFNLAGYGPDWHARLADAQATVDDTARTAKFDELQQSLYDDGGEVVWGFQEQLNASTPGLDGVELTQSIPLLTHATQA